MKLPATHRAQLLAHLAGDQPIIAARMRVIKTLQARRLMKTLPPGYTKPRRSALTNAGRRLALELQAEGAPAP